MSFLIAVLLLSALFAVLYVLYLLKNWVMFKLTGMTEDERMQEYWDNHTDEFDGIDGW